MTSPQDGDQALIARWISNELSESDPTLQELLVRRPELREQVLGLRRTSAQLDELASETETAWAEVELQAGHSLLMHRAALRAGVDLTEAEGTPLIGRRPKRSSYWVLTAAAALLVLWAAWRPWSGPAAEPHGYLSDPAVEAPVGKVSSFRRFFLDEVPARALVTIVVYDQDDAMIVEWNGRGPEWNPTDEERAVMRAAGSIRWQYTVEDPVGGLRSGEVEAKLELDRAPR